MALNVRSNRAHNALQHKSSKENAVPGGKAAGKLRTRNSKKEVDALLDSVVTKAIQIKTILKHNDDDAMDVDDEIVQVMPRVQEYPEIPEGIPNVDDIESDNPQLCAEYAPFIYGYLRQQESQMKIQKDFLRGCHVTGKMRGVLLDWLIEVHHQFNMIQETLYLAIFMIDRFLQQEGMTIKRNKLQLVGVAAMFTASKIEEIYAPEIGDFVYITDNAYSSMEIRQMEMRILGSLNFNVLRPLPLHFLRRYSKAGDVDVLHHTLAKYLIELAQLEYDLVHIAPSMLSAACLYLAILMLEPEDVDINAMWTPSLQYYSTYSHSKLFPIVCKLAVVARKAGKGKLKAVYNKYCGKKMMKVATIEELKGPVLNMLAEREVASQK